MKRPRFLAALAALTAALTAPLSATVTINLAGAVLSNAAGTAIPNGGLVLLVSSTTNSTFTAPPSTASTAVGSVIADDDIIIGSATIDSAASGITGGFAKAINITFSGNLNAGDPIQLYWFPTLTSASTTLGQGVAYGSYRTDSIASDSDIAWVLPADGATATLKVLTTTAGGSIADTAGRATLTTDGTVVVAPAITTHPVSQSVNVGASVTFSVTATGTSLTYQWKKDGNNISGATSSSYNIPSAASGNAGSYTVTVANSAGTVTSNAATLAVTIPAPTITTHPASLTVNEGSAATFTVAANGTGLSYLWFRNGISISGATSASYTIATTTSASAGNYTVQVSNSSGNVTSNIATLTVLPVFTAPAPEGYAASVTGGGTPTLTNHTVVTTAADFRTLAESTASGAAIITVSGSLNLGTTKVAVKSNKTIQGLNTGATLIGNLELASGVSNVVIRGLTISNPSGSAITVTGATNVFINHVSFVDTSDTALRIVAGADNVAVTWCEFYFNAGQTTRLATLIGATSGETKAIKVTLANNAFSDRVDQQMPDSTWGQVHLFNNYFNPAGTANTSGSIARANAQFLSERNQYTSIVSPLTKTGGGLIRAIGNGYTTTTGTAADAGTDTVFTPTYSYRLMNVANVATSVLDGAGNTAGAASGAANTGSASITASGTSITTGSAFTLTAANISGITASTYQWRLGNVDIANATSASYTVASAQSANAGIYTVAASNTSGETIVSTPVTISVTAAPVTPPPSGGGSSGGGGGGGGGSPSVWFLLALGALAGLRRWTKRG